MELLQVPLLILCEVAVLFISGAILYRARGSFRHLYHDKLHWCVPNNNTVHTNYFNVKLARCKHCGAHLKKAPQDLTWICVEQWYQ